MAWQSLRGSAVGGVVALAGAVSAGAGCTIAMYPGPKRPASEIARIVAHGNSSIRNIDGMDLPVGSRFTVLPGLHAVTVGSEDASQKAVCFKAQAGHWYDLDLVGFDHDGTVSVSDIGANDEVRSLEVGPGETCAAVASAWDPPRPHPAPRPVVAAARAPVESDNANDGDAERRRASDPPSENANDSDAEGRQASDSTPPAPVTPAVDDETPRAPRRPSPAARSRSRVSPREDEPPRWMRHPGTGPTFELGAFLGGTDLASTADQNGNKVGTLSGGSGVVLGVGWIWTPLWAGDDAGFGLGASIGLKYDSISAGDQSVSLLRFPAALAAHTFLHIGDRWWILLRGGIQKELGVSLSVDPYGSASMDGSLGALGEGGLYYVAELGEQRTAMLFAFRYTSGTDSNPGGSFSASAGGIVFAVHYNL